MDDQSMTNQQACAMLMQGKPLTNVVIPSLDISNQTFQQDVVIENCIIEHLDFNRCLFKGKVNFTRTKIGKNPTKPSDRLPDANSLMETINFCFCYFDNEAIFDSCHFHSPADFSHTNFSQGAKFQETEFHHEALFMNATIDGFLSFEGTKFFHEVNFSETFFGKEVIFKESQFFGQSDFTKAQFQNAEFQKAQFHDIAIFDLAKFDSWADFSGAIFGGELNFVQTIFENGADFSNAKFCGQARFEGACIAEDCYFNEAEFQMPADFYSMNFAKGTDFRKCLFLDRAEFMNATIAEGSFIGIVANKPFILSGVRSEKLDFQDAIFQSDFIFSNATANQSANFADVKFEKSACFDNATLTKCCFDRVNFKDQCSFKATKFQVNSKFQNALFDTADFSKAVFLGPAFFDETKFYHTVLFRNAQFEHGEVCFKSVTFLERADFTGARINDTICLQDLIGEAILITWDQIAGKLARHHLQKCEEATKVYGLLKNIFERQNRYEDMDRAYRMFKRMERKAQAQKDRNLWMRIKRFFNFLILDLGSGYGTRPINIAITTLIIILLFGGIYYFGSHQIIVGGNPLSLSNPLERLGFCIYFSAVSFVTLGAENLSPNYYSWLKYVVTCQAFLGFFLMTLFVATFTRKVIR